MSHSVILPLEGNPWQTRSSRAVYANPWIHVREDEVLTPGGTEGIYGVVEFQNIALGIVPIDSEGYTYLIGQWRYPLKAYSWELPEGGGPMGIDPLESAKRELLEETGLSAQKWTKILSLHLSNSTTDEKGHIYLAEGLTQGRADPEDTEKLQLLRLPLPAAVELVLGGQITDAISVAGLLTAAHHLRHP